MTVKVAMSLIASAMGVTSAFAEICVGPAYDRPLPGAVDVVLHQTDIRSAQYPGVWQEGTIEGRFYQIFANNMAILKEERNANTWSIAIDCRQKTCSAEMTRSPPDTAKKLAKKIEQCLSPVQVKNEPAKKDLKSALAVGPAGKPAASTSKPAESKTSQKQTMSKRQPLPASVQVKTPAAQKGRDLLPSKGSRTKMPATGNASSAENANWYLPAKSDAKQNSIELQGFGKVIVAGKPFKMPRGQPATAQRTRPPSKPSQDWANSADTELICIPVKKAKPTAAPYNCGRSMVPVGGPVLTLQRLLVLVGTNPGEIDGAYGVKTQKAMQQILGPSAKSMGVSKAIAELDALLCKRK
jgi:hypothetical protein